VSNSRLPQSSQSDVHPRLAETLERHFAAPWRQPVRAHSRQAFASVEKRARDHPRIVLDSGCGTGRSTARLAEGHPDALVLGIDQSRHRLSKAPLMPDNAQLVRANLADFWRLALAKNWRLDAHYLLYPNPWPKPGHLQRRWHAHPVFPELLRLGGQLEIRSNFYLYLKEFCCALRHGGVADGEVVSFHPEFPISPFEAKYSASGHELFRLTVLLETTA